MDPQVDPEVEHDLLFVGAGASTSYVLLALLESLRDEPPAAPLRIAVVERAPDPFTGVPYGGRAARTSLLITALRDFLPDAERALFVSWLAENKDWVFQEFLAAGGRFSSRWWERHQDAIGRDDFESLYLPRYTFGEFLAGRTWQAIGRAQAEGLATTTVVQDDVVSLEPSGTGYLVRCDGQVLGARRVVLATGSPPVLPRLRHDVGRPAAVLLDDPFADMDGAVAQVATAMAQRPGQRPPHIVFIGANAGTMDMLFQLNDLAGPGAAEAVHTVVSPTGRLPERLDDRRAPRPFHPEALAALERAGTATAVAVYEAAVEDIERGRAAGLSVSDTLPPISRAVVDLLRTLPEDQRAEFADRWGVELGRHQRRAGWEYFEVVEHLMAEGRLRLVAGAFLELLADDDGRLHAGYEAGGTRHRLEPPADAVVNCAGPARSLRHSAPRLLAQLLTTGTCRLTPCGSGIAVGPSLDAAPGLYVMGPLLAGNIIKGAPVWHMEHCGRISAFGSALGADLARSLVSSAG